MRMLVLAALVLAHSAPVAAGEWQRLDGAEIDSALSGRSLIYDGAKQVFYASGRTLYDAGQPSWGYWRVEGDKYCSQWPPGQRWDCYALERSDDGQRLRFLDSEGRPFAGRYGGAGQ